MQFTRYLVDWNKLAIMALFLSVLSYHVLAGETIQLSAQAEQEMTYGLDFERHGGWRTLNTESKKQLAEAVAKSGVQFIRIPLLGDAEVTEGKIEESVYADTLDLLSHLKTARPDIQFYATPRAINPAIWGRHILEPYTCYPLWVSIPDPSHPLIAKYNAEKAADFFVRHIQFLSSRGFRVAYLDLKDELRIKNPPELTETIAKLIREKLGSQTPLFVGPSGIGAELSSIWLRDASKGKGPDDFFLDVVATHDTNGRPKEKLPDFELMLPHVARVKKPLWISEANGLEGPDKAVLKTIRYLFSYVQRGVGGFSNFRTLGQANENQKMFTANDDGSLTTNGIFLAYQHLATSTAGSRYIPLQIPESLKNFSAASFQRNNQLVFWAVNDHKYALKEITVDLGGRKIADQNIRIVLPLSPDEKEKSENAKPKKSKDIVKVELLHVAESSFTLNIPGTTLVYFEIKIR